MLEIKSDGIVVDHPRTTVVDVFDGARYSLER